MGSQRGSSGVTSGQRASAAAAFGGGSGGGPKEAGGTGDPTAALLEGVVYDGQREPLPRAMAKLSNARERSTLTDNGGAFAFRRLQADRYVLVVSRSGYGSVTRRVTVTSGQRKSVRITLMPAK